MRVREVGLDNIIGRESPQAAQMLLEKAAGTEEISFAQATGFHVYGEIRLLLKLTAADDATDAQRYLKVLEQFTIAAEVAAEKEGARLLEMQGERVHLFIPTDVEDSKALQRALRFCVAMNELVYGHVARVAGDSFDGFAMAVDHGRTVFVRHGSGPQMSVVSLSPAANAPAKRLGKDKDGSVLIPAKHVTMRTISLKNAGYTVSSASEWENVRLDPLPAEMLTARDKAYVDAMSDGLLQVMRSIQDRPQINFQDIGGNFYTESMALQPGQAVRVSAFFLRADLSGFTKQVASAFANGGAAIAELVQRFASIVKHAEQFKSHVAAPNQMRLPWAGDCANMAVLPPPGKTYSDSRELIPCDVPAEWHLHWKLNGQSDWLAPLLSNATWAVGCAGGDDDDDGRSPVVVLAVLRGRERNYLVAAGWSVGRSWDALEAGVSGNDTVIPQEDWAALTVQRAQLFKVLDSRFQVTKKRVDSDDLGKHLAQTAREPKQIAIMGSSIVIPAARPHWIADNGH